MSVRFAVAERARALSRIAAAAIIVVIAAAASLAQQPVQPNELSALESLKLSLDQLEITANRDGLSAAALVDLQQQLMPLRDEIRIVVDQRQLRLDLGAAAARASPSEAATKPVAAGAHDA